METTLTRTIVVEIVFCAIVCFFRCTGVNIVYFLTNTSLYDYSTERKKTEICHICNEHEEKGDGDNIWWIKCSA